MLRRKSIRFCSLAAAVWTTSGAVSHAGDLFSCFHNYNQAAPGCYAPVGYAPVSYAPMQYAPMQSYVVQQPVSYVPVSLVQQSTVQSGQDQTANFGVTDLLDIACRARGIVGGSSNSGGGGGSNCSSLQETNAVLTRVESQVKDLKALIEKRGTGKSSSEDIESQQEMANALDVRINDLADAVSENNKLVAENTRLVQTNTEAIFRNAEAIKATQQVIAGLQRKTGLAPAVIKTIETGTEVFLNKDGKLVLIGKTEKPIEKVEVLGTVTIGKKDYTWAAFPKESNLTMNGQDLAGSTAYLLPPGSTPAAPAAAPANPILEDVPMPEGVPPMPEGQSDSDKFQYDPTPRDGVSSLER